MMQFDARFCEQNRMIVLEESAGQLVIGTVQESDRTARDRISRIVSNLKPGSKVSYRRLDEGEFLFRVSELCASGKNGKNGRAQEHRIFPPEFVAPFLKKIRTLVGIPYYTAAQETATARSAKRDGFEISGIDTGSDIVTALNSILTRAKDSRASDIHIERDHDSTTIRLRIDGELVRLRSLDGDAGKALTNRIKLISNLDTLESRRPQDGRFTITAGGKLCDIRVSAVPCSGGESVALRFLETDSSGIDLSALGFGEKAFRLLEGLPRMRSGLVLVTGPTGSGKTTTLSALVKLCSPSKRKVISIEDPVEYKIPGVVQVQTHGGLGLTFAELLKRIVRQDPDVLMIGEIRDDETAEQAVRAAMTGHLVFATMHARSVSRAAERLQSFGIDGRTAAGAVCAVIGQRLVRSGDAGRIPLAEIALEKNGITETVLSFKEEIARCLAEKSATRGQLEEVFGEAI
ncbi:MAG TPA: ATPase, T2SS/T4P/T4SS family [Treponemataceae bacterium]|nr:ATPase, T2SS/T4P/T4SS family [Treponemataceae bacterium]